MVGSVASIDERWQVAYVSIEQYSGTILCFAIEKLDAIGTGERDNTKRRAHR